MLDNNPEYIVNILLQSCFLFFKSYINQAIGLMSRMVWVTKVQSQVESYPRLKK